MWIYKASGGEFFKPEMVWLPVTGAGLLMLATSATGIIGIMLRIVRKLFSFCDNG